MTWCVKSISLLKKLWDEGHSASTIAREINALTGQKLSRSAVIGKRYRLGLPDRIPRAPKRPSGGTQPWSTSSNGYKRPSVPKAVAPPDHPPALPPIVPPDAVAYDAARMADGLVALVDLEGHHCRWPIGDPRKPEFGFCGAKSVPNQPYCKHHAMRAAPHISSRPYQKPEPARPYTPIRSKELV
jgi:GcrA cell cycle regulator